MARPAKVWYRWDIGWWMITLGGVKTRLLQGPDDEKHRILAEEKFVELRKLQRVAPPAPTARTADVVEAYLAWSRQHLSANTHRINRYYCQLFAEHCGTVPARDLRPFHVTRWVAAMMDPARVERESEERRAAIEAGAVEKRYQGQAPKVWGESTAHNGRVTAFRVFFWARDEGILPENPLAGVKRPKPPGRRRAMSDDEFHKLYEHAGGPFADYLLALRETGARPKEVRDLLWAQVQEDRWVLTKHKTAKATGRPRVIILTGAMRALMGRLMGNGHTHVFLNTEGEPWPGNAVRLQITRLRTKLGLAGDLCAYLCRHGFGTRATATTSAAVRVCSSHPRAVPVTHWANRAYPGWVRTYPNGVRGRCHERTGAGASFMTCLRELLKVVQHPSRRPRRASLTPENPGNH